MGLSMSSEKKQREVAKDLVGDNLEGESVPMTFNLKQGGVEMRAVPLVYIPDLAGKIFNMLDENEKYGCQAFDKQYMYLHQILFPGLDV